LLAWYVSFMLAICSRSKISGVQLSPERIQRGHSNAALRRCILTYPKWIRHCPMVLWNSWILNVSHPPSNGILGMENSFFNCYC
jgi:hypothetical protein